MKKSWEAELERRGWKASCIPGYSTDFWQHREFAWRPMCSTHAEEIEAYVETARDAALEEAATAAEAFTPGLVTLRESIPDYMKRNIAVAIRALKIGGKA